MKFLVLAALVAVAAARPQNFHDDVFHFSSDVHPTTFAKSSFEKTYKEVQQPAFVVKSAPVISQYVQKVQAAPVISHVHQPVLFRSVEQEIPAVTSVHHVHQPVYSQVSEVSHELHHHVVPSTAFVASRASFAPQYTSSAPAFRILKQVQEFDPAGYYRTNFETENGISQTEQGSLKDVQSKEGPVAAKEGSYSYTGPDGVIYTVNYIADEFGFRASGAHLPVAPEIPAEIQRSLELIASQPEKYDDNGNLLSKRL